MKQSFKQTGLRKAVGDIILLASIYGTGIGEVVVRKEKDFIPATQVMKEVDSVAIGTKSKDKVTVTLNPISPQNFLIDPNATTVQDAMGCAIEEFVSAHHVAKNMEEGVYLKADLGGTSVMENDLDESWIDEDYDQDKVKIVRYYGLVPEKLLDNPENGEVYEGTGDILEEYGNLVEAIVVIGNDNVLLKAEANPYMLKDRPIVAYQDDTVPKRFWGRGIAEKGYNMQRAIDAQLRAHLDSLALTTAPMMGMDATRLPRGARFEVRPGKTILTNGDPREVLQPFQFGQTDASNLETAKAFQTMLLQATNTMNTQDDVKQATGGELSVALATVLKKNKRTLVNFQDNFLVPFITKVAHRFMQFAPEEFPVADYKFVANSSLGNLAKEVEQLQFLNLLKTLGPNSPIVPILLEGIIENSSIENRAMLIETLQKGKEAQEKQQAQTTQMQMGQVQAEIALNNSEAQENMAQAQKYQVDAQLAPQEIQAKLMTALATNLPSESDEQAAEFKRRKETAELMLKQAEMEIKKQDMIDNKEIVKLQMQQKQRA
jgi:sulfur carrier protein ThiS